MGDARRLIEAVSRWRPIVLQRAKQHGLRPIVVAAIVARESSGNPWAYNPEPAYEHLWDLRDNAPYRRLTGTERRAAGPPVGFPSPSGADADAEFWGQRASWGLMQVMGAVAREVGFSDPFLTKLCDPEHGIEFGCRALAMFGARMMKLGSHSEDAMVAAYNGGFKGNLNAPYRSQAYLSRVRSAEAALEDAWG